MQSQKPSTPPEHYISPSDLPYDVESPQSASYSKLSHRIAARYLQDAQATGRFGSGPREKDEREYHPLVRFLLSIPWPMLLIQLVWSSTITALAYLVARDNNSVTDTLSLEFWSSRFNLAPSVVSGVGWALFVLLGFFIREAAARYREALVRWGSITALLRRIIRLVVQNYKECDWHPGDMDRIAAHLVAFPVALKMTLRDEREREQLDKILTPKDVDDVLKAPSMYLHCSKVVRSYFASIQDDQVWGFQPRTANNPAGWGTAFFYAALIDEMESQAAGSERIKNFQAAAGYTSHLRIFLYIWLLFVPISIIRTSGWFTVLWSVIITYGIGMLFRIALNLNEPYGFDLEDIKLNRLCAETALSTLDFFSRSKIKLDDVIREPSEPAFWLHRPEPDEDSALQKKVSARVPAEIWKRFAFLLTNLGNVAIPLAVFTVWTTIVTFIAWSQRIRETPGGDPLPERCNLARWWCLYIPLDSSTTSYIGLGIFLLLGFWVNDAYGRYKRGIDLWHVTLRKSLEHLTGMFTITFREGAWHEGDRERLVSHIAALPYAVKLKLRRSRDADELREVLSSRDYQALIESDDFPDHCLSVIRGYKESADMLHPTFKLGINPMRSTRYNIDYYVWEFESALEECEAMRKFPIPHAFTYHLKLFSAVWLAAIPVAFVEFYGFLSFVFLIPIAYSILNLMSMGTELADPFGTDPHDIPLDSLCDDFRASIRRIYTRTRMGPGSLLRDTGYDRESFKPKFWTSNYRDEKEDEGLTLRKSIKDLLNSFPSVDIRAVIVVLLWTAGAVVASYFSRTAFSESQQENCEAWCSPIEVNGGVLLEIGFALFLILSFRASDAVTRYDQGALLLGKVGATCREFSVELCKYYDDGAWHRGDKERLIAHMIQVPIALRDELLGIKRTAEQEKEGVLSEEDRHALENSANAVDHCLFVLQSYFTLHDVGDYEYRCMDTENHTCYSAAYVGINRCFVLQKIIAEIRVMKKFPVVKSYTKHQRLFTGLWLFLLPLAMTASSGWWTILWAPLISYGVLGLEAVASKLADPLGDDSIDIPVDDMLKTGAADVIDAVNSVKWGRKHHVNESKEVSEPHIGVVLDGRTPRDEYSLPHFSREPVDEGSFAKDPIPTFKTPRSPIVKKSFYAHVLRSVPWWALLAIATWATIAIIISFASRDVDAARNPATNSFRWWISRMTIDPLVGSYVSFAAFMLLGFYVQAAFNRYHRAGTIWGDDLRALCHAFSMQVLTFAPAGAWHEGDHDRIIGHIASLPIVLKMQARGRRNLVELKGLLSPSDIGRIHCAHDMARHCVDVLRSYIATAVESPEELNTEVEWSSQRFGFLMARIRDLENVILVSQFLSNVSIAYGFTVLLRTMLGIFFILLPFILAESSGWFTILWVTIIGYGVLGMYAVADELQQPFGTDLNDLDLDILAADIVKNVLFVQKNYRRGIDTFIIPSIVDSGEIWGKDGAIELSPLRGTSDGQSTSHSELDVEAEHAKRKGGNRLGRALRTVLSRVPRPAQAIVLAANSVSWWMLPLAAAWAAASVGIAKVVSDEFPFSGAAQTACEPAFCSRIAVDAAVKEYVGFALFLLLGFRLYDSHWRYVTGMRVWQDGIIATSGMIANRIFEGYEPNTWHEGDKERIAAHLAAFSVVTASRMRGERFREDILRTFMHPDDVARLSRVIEKGDYCSNVVRGYLMKGDVMNVNGMRHSIGSNEHWHATYLLDLLKGYAAELERIVAAPLPFGYVQHIRIFLAIWLALLPLGLVEEEGWIAILWTVFIAYGVIGVERWSQELSNPFGTDISDLPLEDLRQKAVDAVHYNLNLYRDGSNAVVKSERSGFPGASDMKASMLGEY